MAGSRVSLTTSWTYPGANTRCAPAPSARVPRSVRSVSVPSRTVSTPEERPWSCSPLPCPGTQDSSHTSQPGPVLSRWYQRVGASGAVGGDGPREADELGHGGRVFARRLEEVRDFEDVAGDLEVAVAVHGGAVV